MTNINWGSFVDKKIREAMDQGEFENLKGEGKPLPLEENPLEEEGKWAAHHLLKENGFTLPWIAKRAEILEEVERAKVPLNRAFEIFQDRISFRENDAQAKASWERSKAAYVQRVAAINKKIDDYNLMVPADNFQMLNRHPTKDIEQLEATL